MSNSSGTTSHLRYCQECHALPDAPWHMTAHVLAYHEPVVEFYRATGPYGYLSNLYSCDVRFADHFEPRVERVFKSSEHAFQYGKPRDRATAEWVIAAPKPHLVAMAGHGLLGFDIAPEWQQRKLARMHAVVRAKFTQNPALANFLLATGNAHIIEASKTDPTWGIGKNGKGKNLLGEILEQVRDELRLMQTWVEFYESTAAERVVERACRVGLAIPDLADLVVVP